MPLVRIDVTERMGTTRRELIGSLVHQALVETLNIPANDRFQILTGHGPGGMVYDTQYLGIARGAELIIIQVTLNAGRSVALKQAFYARVATLLVEQAAVRAEDILISLVEVAPENWSFGNGVAQYA